MISRGLAPIYQAALSDTAGSLYQIEFKQNDVLDNGGSNLVDFAFPTLTSNTSSFGIVAPEGPVTNQEFRNYLDSVNTGILSVIFDPPGSPVRIEHLDSFTSN